MHQRHRADAIAQARADLRHPLFNLALHYFVQARQLAGFAKQIDKDTDLGLEDQRVDRLAQVVHRAGAVAFEDVFVIPQISGQENDRQMLVLFALLDQLRQLETVDPRHADIEHDDREIVVEQCQQRLVAR